MQLTFNLSHLEVTFFHPSCIDSTVMCDLHTEQSMLVQFKTMCMPALEKLFLSVTPVCICVCVSTCNTIKQLTSLFMAPANDIMDRYRPSRLTSALWASTKGDKGNAVLAVHFIRGVICLIMSSKMECFIYKGEWTYTKWII